MKHLKYTVAALAVIAVASFTPSAMAQTSQLGDVVLGIYDTTGTVATSLEFDLGSYTSVTSITNGTESWNLGSLIETTYSSDTSANLVYDIVASAGNGAANGGLNKAQFAYTASTPLSGQPSTATSGNIGTLTTDLSSQGTAAATGSNYFATTVANSTSGSFASNGYGSTSFASGSDLNTAYTLPAPSAGPDLGFYTMSHGVSGSTLVGTFQFSEVGGNDILTFDPTAVPEPSAYALVLCAVALFWVLKRRHSAA